MQFKFTSKGTLSGRKINYIFHETEVDVTDHVDSKEYKQMRLLVACCHSVKEKEKYKKPDALQKIELLFITMNIVQLLHLKRMMKFLFFFCSIEDL